MRNRKGFFNVFTAQCLANTATCSNREPRTLKFFFEVALIWNVNLGLSLELLLTLANWPGG